MSVMHRRFRTGIYLFFLGLVLLALLVVFDSHKAYKGYFTTSTQVSIPKGTSAGKAITILKKAGVIRSSIFFKILFAIYGHPRNIKAGTYLFDHPLSPFQVMEKVEKGDYLYVRVTIPEGLRADEIFSILQSEGIGQKNKYLSLFNKTGEIASLDPDVKNLEGYLFPSTYFIEPNSTESSVVSMMTGEFKMVWKNNFKSDLEFKGLTPHYIVIMASLIEKETSLKEERALVSSVFVNRLRAGMPLQSDPSIIYALFLENRWNGDIRKEDMLIKSPYNTYINRGLPPGPVCSPGLEAMKSAANPVESEYYYFVSKNNGSHTFSKNLEEHDRKVILYQKKIR